MKLNNVELVIRNMRDLRTANPDMSWDDAARRVKATMPDVVHDVMDRIGSWPSSEPELAALQRVYP